ncbi:cell wall-binding protein [uncultured Clostridium sp.]|uniref:cell wall-binding protein n=1 Tax=uncultured Clostridium sp. TaxID=59620 RepID=UPI0028E9765C|nr:cell wall-binding protein [uncultured Clostridium sp.]
MTKKIISSLLTALLIMGAIPIGVSGEWRQNSDSSWSWMENGYYKYYDGWEQINGKWYYFKIGKMQTGWIKYCNTDWYYLGNDGAMQTGWIKDGGISYYLKDNGELAKDTVIDGSYFNSSGIVQPKEKQKVLVDDKYVKITYLGVDKVGELYDKAIIEIENKSAEDIRLTIDNITVDGYEIPYVIFGTTIISRDKLIKSIDCDKAFVRTNFENMNGEFVIKLQEDYKTLKTENFSIKF